MRYFAAQSIEKNKLGEAFEQTTVTVEKKQLAEHQFRGWISRVWGDICYNILLFEVADEQFGQTNALFYGYGFARFPKCHPAGHPYIL